MTLRARHLGVHWTLTSRVTAYDPPASFVDEQVRGPFAQMRHEHSFQRQPDGSTVMVDRMSFRASWGPLGAVASLVLGPYVRRLLVGTSPLRHGCGRDWLRPAHVLRPWVLRRTRPYDIPSGTADMMTSGVHRSH